MLHMSKMVQIRNVPDELHRELKARAARAGMSLSDYLLAQLRDVVAYPTVEELTQRIAALPPVHVSETPAAAVRAERDARR